MCGRKVAGGKKGRENNFVCVTDIIANLGVWLKRQMQQVWVWVVDYGRSLNSSSV